MTSPIDAAAQRVLNAAADLSQLKSERIEVEGRAAKAATAKIASKASAADYRNASTRHADALIELERIDCLIADAEVEKRAAEAASKRASFDVEASRLSDAAARVSTLSSAFAVQLGQHLAAHRELRAAVDQTHTLSRRLAREAATLGTSLDDGAAASALARAGELLPLKLKAETLHYALTAMSPALLGVVESALRTALGAREPKAGVNYGLASRVQDLVSGEYETRLQVIEAVG